MPDGLRVEIGVRELWISLGAVNHREAVQLSRLASVKVDAKFEEARARLRKLPLDTVTDAQLYHLARAYFHRLEASAETVPFNEAERRVDLDISMDELAGVGDASFEDATLQSLTRSFAEWAKVRLDPGTPSFWHAIEAVQRAYVEHYSREIDRLQLRREIHYDPAFVGVSRDMVAPKAPPMSVRRAVEAYIAEPSRGGVSKKTRDAWKFRFAAIQELLGADRAVTEISREDVRNLRDALLALPPNAPKRWPNVPLRTVIDLAKRDELATISLKSVTHYLQANASLFRWLMAEEHITKTPTAGLGAPQKVLAHDERRRPFTTPELQLVLTSGPYAGALSSRGWQWWTPLIAMFSGLRLGEIVGLQAAEIAERDGVAVFIVRPNAMRGLKTDQSTRIVPLHPTLIQLGLAAHAEAAPKGGPLFSDLPKMSGGYSNAVQKHFGRHIRMLITDRRVVFHSLRHNFRDALREAFVPPEISAALGGWKFGNAIMNGYGTGHRAATLAAELGKITYPGLALEHLYS